METVFPEYKLFKWTIPIDYLYTGSWGNRFQETHCIYSPFPYWWNGLYPFILKFLVSALSYPYTSNEYFSVPNITKIKNIVLWEAGSTVTSVTQYPKKYKTKFIILYFYYYIIYTLNIWNYKWNKEWILWIS